MIVPVLEEVRMLRDSLACFPSVKRKEVYEIAVLSVFICVCPLKLMTHLTSSHEN
jgi:hypothetical protein